MSHDLWKRQAAQPANTHPNAQRTIDDYSRPGRTRAGPPQATPANPQPFNMSNSMLSPRATPPSNVSMPRRASADFRSPRSNGYGAASPGLLDEKKPLGALRHSDSTGTLAEDYEVPLAREKDDLKPYNQTRGSKAAAMAASGEIPKKAGLRLWRSEEHSGTFLRGGKRRACSRCCICSFILAVLIVIAVIVAFLLWVRPPSVTFQGVETPAGLSEVVVITGGFQLNFNLLIGVINPNYFGAFFPLIAAQAFYPGDNTALGGGQMLNVDIKKRTNNTIHFPFQINYTQSIDPGNVILQDIAAKCGFLQGSTPSPIKVNYALTLKIRVLAVDIAPTVRSSTTFSCPLQESDIDSLLKAGGISGIISETTGSTNSATGGGDRVKRKLWGLLERADRLLKRGPEPDLELRTIESSWYSDQMH